MAFGRNVISKSKISAKVIWQKEIARALHMKQPENVIKRQNQDIIRGFMYIDASEESSCHSIKHLQIKHSASF